jgi:glycosyltransferase involved in cell wall biosynthesis
VLLLFATTEGSGGIQRFNRMLMAAFEKLDVRCDVFSLYEQAKGASPQVDKPRITRQVFGGSKLRYALATARAIWFGRYDHVVAGHINLLNLLAFALSMRPFRRPKAWLVAHGIEVWNGIDPLRRVALRRIWRVLSVSRYTQQRIQIQAPELSTERFLLFPLALSDTWTASQFTTEMLNNAIDLPQRFLLSVARLDANERPKGILTVLKSLQLVNDRSLKYVIAGAGDDQAFLLEAARRYGVAEQVRFLGSVSDQQLSHLYRGCLAFVLPSAKEGFGLVFLEAMFFGAPVVGAAEKGILDVISHNETGLLVTYGDVTALSDTINRLTSDDSLRERLSAKARESVVKDGPFTFNAFVLRLARVFDVTVRVNK